MEIIKKQMTLSCRKWTPLRKKSGWYTLTLSGFKKGNGNRAKRNKGAEYLYLKKKLGRHLFCSLYNAKMACRQLNTGEATK